MTLNVRRTFWSIFGILFVFSVTSAAFAQQPDSALSQSQFEKILEKIEESEKETRAYIDQKFDKLDTKIDQKFDKLDTKIDDLNTKFHDLDKKVAVLESDVDKLFTIIIGIALAVGAHFLFFIGSHIYTYWRNKANLVPKVAAEIATKNAAAESKEELDEENTRQRILRDNPPSDPV